MSTETRILPKTIWEWVSLKDFSPQRLQPLRKKFLGFAFLTNFLATALPPVVRIWISVKSWQGGAL